MQGVTARLLMETSGIRRMCKDLRLGSGILKVNPSCINQKRLRKPSKIICKTLCHINPCQKLNNCSLSIQSGSILMGGQYLGSSWNWSHILRAGCETCVTPPGCELLGRKHVFVAVASKCWIFCSFVFSPVNSLHTHSAKFLIACNSRKLVYLSKLYGNGSLCQNF